MGNPLVSLTPLTAVTDGLSVSAADGRHLAKPVAARVLSLANPGPLAIGQAVWTGGGFRSRKRQDR